jgi:hypothetical protein
VEVKSIMALASACKKAKGLVWRIALLEGELAEAHQDREMAEENSWGLSDAVADAKQQREESEKESQERFLELTLLWAWGTMLCLAIFGPSRVRNHQSEGMQIAAIHHIEMAEELAAL